MGALEAIPQPFPAKPAADVVVVEGTPDRPAGRLAALDGLRGIAVLAVMAFHAGLGFVRGGLLGVDVFFVLSGFLITALLVSEHARTGGISLGGFWRRRLRRLLPAMLLMLVVTAIVWRFTAEVDELAGVRRDAVATLTYVANWHFAIDGQSYFEHFRAPSPLLHMWSLAVEEQFYLVWPVVAILILRRGTPVLLRRVALGGALLSTGLLALLSLLGMSTERLYYGTDTRMAALLIGAAFATLITPFGAGSAREPGPRRTQQAASVLGGVAAVLLVLALLFVNGQSPVLYRGGFLLVALLVSVLLASALLAPQGPTSRVLSVRPLVAVGRISYGLYLWHWPVFLFLSAEHTGLSGVRLVVVRFTATFAVASASWFLLERRVLAQEFLGRRVLILPAITVVTALALLVAPLPAGPASGDVDLNALERQSMAAPAPPPNLAAADINSRPVRVLISGDSVALTLGVGVYNAAARNDTSVYARGLIGCGISTFSPIRTGGTTGPVPDQCRNWPSRWAEDVETYKPDVTAVLLGRWESMDRMFNGHWASLGDPEFDAYLAGRLDYAIDILTKDGGKVAFLTAPTYDSLNLPDGSDPPEDDPARVARWNQLLHDAAARHPDNVRVFDFAPLVEPHGTYQRYSDDKQVELRSADGIHIGFQGGIQAGDALLPQLRDWARGVTR